MEELAPGFRFYPTEEELSIQGSCVMETLSNGFSLCPDKREKQEVGDPTVPQLTGYWKATGSPGYVYSSDNRVIGVKKNMVFYEGKAPTGRKAIWKMNEYKAIEEEAATQSCSPIPKLRHEFSLCRIYVISGSFRAFDRRPGGRVARNVMNQQVYGGGGAAKTSHNTRGVEETSSLESSYSGRDHVDLPDQAAAEIANLQMVDGLQSQWGWNNIWTSCSLINQMAMGKQA
ncbi:hypothetical protein L1049_012722 [Liquidambar formosana]|uniref:NAC domain-containing protein n=1 Tax=Liquidambar formosana TaxID=63359 RepID=A0AAP0RKT1_LIQFO